MSHFTPAEDCGKDNRKRTKSEIHLLSQHTINIQTFHGRFDYLEYVQASELVFYIMLSCPLSCSIRSLFDPSCYSGWSKEDNR